MDQHQTIQPDLGPISRACADGPIHGISGWPLHDILRLDDARRGFLAECCRRSDVRWRQSLFAALASGVMDRAAEFLARSGGAELGGWGCGLGDLARALLRLSAPDILTCALGSCPKGILAVLARLGFEPMPDWSAYQRLHDIFTDPTRLKQRRTILELPTFNQLRLDVIETLDPLLLCPRMALRVRCGETAKQVNDLLALVRRYCSGADDATIQKSATDLRVVTPRRWLRDWLERRADQGLPAPPWDGEAGITPLRNASDFARAARLSKTCVGSRVIQMVSGKAAYYLADQEGREIAVCCAVRLYDGWLLSHLAGYGNRTLSADRTAELRDRFRAAGIHVLAERDIGALSGLSGGLGGYADEFELEDLEV